MTRVPCRVLVLLLAVVPASALPHRRVEEADVDGHKYVGPAGGGICAFNDFDDAGINLANVNGPGTPCDGKCAVAGIATTEETCTDENGDDASHTGGTCCKWARSHVLGSCSQDIVQTELFQAADTCCMESTETCSEDGYPKSCNLGCASVIVPVATECLHAFEKLGLHDAIAPFSASAKLCVCQAEIMACAADKVCQTALDILPGLDEEEYAEFFTGDDGSYDHFNPTKMPSNPKAALLKCYQDQHYSVGPPPPPFVTPAPEPTDDGQPGDDQPGDGGDSVPAGPASFTVSGTPLHAENAPFMGTYVKKVNQCSDKAVYELENGCPDHVYDDGVKTAFLWKENSGEWGIGCDFIEHSADMVNCDATWGSGLFFSSLTQNAACADGPDGTGCAGHYTEGSGASSVRAPNPTIKVVASSGTPAGGGGDGTPCVCGGQPPSTAVNPVTKAPLGEIASGSWAMDPATKLCSLRCDATHTAVPKDAFMVCGGTAEVGNWIVTGPMACTAQGN